MITLYVKTGCPHCAKVLAVLSANNIPFEEKNVADEAISNELIGLGGKRQMPFMVDGDVQMYEANDIVNYLQEKYVPKTPGKPKIHFAQGTDVCPS